jgi:hypothetical protein
MREADSAGEQSAAGTVIASAPDQAVVPDPRPEPSLKPPQIKMPWSDGGAAKEIAFDKLTRHGQRHAALSGYVDLFGGPDAFAEDLVASTSAEFRRQLIELLSK